MSARSLGHEVGPEMGHSTNACVTLEDEDRDPEMHQSIAIVF